MAEREFPTAEMDRVGEEFDGRFGIYVEESQQQHRVRLPRQRSLPHRQRLQSDGG